MKSVILKEGKAFNRFLYRIDFFYKETKQRAQKYSNEISIINKNVHYEP